MNGLREDQEIPERFRRARRDDSLSHDSTTEESTSEDSSSTGSSNSGSKRSRVSPKATGSASHEFESQPQKQTSAYIAFCFNLMVHFSKR